MSLITPKQLRTLHVARRQVEQLSNGTFGEAEWRMLLRNTGKAMPDVKGHVSAKALDKAGLESVMAFLESKGFQHTAKPAGHWGRRWTYRRGFASDEQIFEIKRLHALESRYPLSALCGRISNHVHSQPEQLTPGQAHKLIEGLKQIVDCNRDHPVMGKLAEMFAADAAHTPREAHNAQ